MAHPPKWVWTDPLSNVYHHPNSSNSLTNSNGAVRLVQNASYTHYRHLTCEKEYRAAQAETAKHSTHFPQFPAIRERYTSAEQKKETAYHEAKKEAIEAAAKLNLFLQSLTSSVISKRNDTDISKDALRLSKDAVRTAEEVKRDMNMKLKKLVERESSKPVADNEALKRLQDEVKQLKAGNQAMKLDFQQYKTENEKVMKGYEERLERFLAAQDGFRSDIGKMREERGMDRRALKEAVEERRKDKEREMDIDTKPGKGEWKVGEIEGVLSALEGRIAAMEKVLARTQAIKPELKTNTSTTATGTPSADAPPWLPPNFHNRWDALLAETQSIQEKLALCDKAVEKADMAMTSSHDAIAEEIGSLQDSINKLASQTTQTSESLQKFTTETCSSLEKLTSDTSSIMTTRLPEMRSQLQQGLGAAWSETFGKLDTRVSTVEKTSTKHSQFIELLSRTIQPLPEKLNHLQGVNERVNILENYRDAIEVTLQGINNQMNNFQFKEIAEKVANIIGVQRVAVIERDLTNLRAQVTGVNGLMAAAQQVQKVQAQVEKQSQQGQQAQGQMKNGESGPAMMNGTSAPPTPGAPPVNAQQLQALQTLQQQQYQQLSNNLQTSVNNTRDINTRVTNLEGHVGNLQTLLTQFPPRFAGLEKRVETQEGKISASVSLISTKTIALETQMRAIDSAVNAVKESISSTEGEMRKLHEVIATVELKIANSDGEREREKASGNSSSTAPALPAGFLDEYAPGNLESVASDLRDLRKQFETKVDLNLKQWASKVKENIQKINRDVKDLTVRLEEVARGEEGHEEGGGQRRATGTGRRAELQGLEGREGSTLSGRGSRGGSMDVDPLERGTGGR